MKPGISTTQQVGNKKHASFSARMEGSFASHLRHPVFARFCAFLPRRFGRDWKLSLKECHPMSDDETRFFPRASERRVPSKKGVAVLHFHISRLLILNLHILRLPILHFHNLRLLFFLPLLPLLSSVSSVSTVSSLSLSLSSLFSLLSSFSVLFSSSLVILLFLLS